MASLRFLISFYTHPVPITILSIAGLSALLLFLISRWSMNAKLRLRSHVARCLISTFFWAFLAFSVVLCSLIEREVVEYPLRMIKFVAGGSFILALCGSMILALISYHYVADTFPEYRSPTKRELASLSGFVSPNIKTYILDKNVPNAFACSGKCKRLFLTTSILQMLTRKELQSVVMHEETHVCEDHTRTMFMLAVVSKLLFFDPFVQHTVRCAHAEMEFIADQGVSKPLVPALLTALQKLDRYHLSTNLPSAYAQSVFWERIKKLKTGQK